MNKSKTKILFLGQLPEDRSPSQRFRIEAYKELLGKNNIAYFFQPFISEKYYPYIYQKGHLLKKVMAVVSGFVQRFAGLFQYRNVDFVFVQREASPVGPPLFEWIYAKLLRKKLIYDFDDAIWITNITEGNKLAHYIKCYWKVKYICRWSHKVSVGNDFLGNYAKQFNQNVVYNPTCVDTDKRFNILSDQQKHPVTIGWTGSHSTIQFLSLGIPVLKRLEEKLPFRFLIICDRKPDFDLHSIDFKPWNKKTEIEDLAQVNIGIMPLKEDIWSEGKCGFKLIQYMALGIPAVASPVGVNKTIIEHGVNGYLCQTDEEWIACLTELLQDEQKRITFGERGRKKIEQEYSVAANTANFLSLFSGQ